MKESETNITINGDYIMYNGVKYEKVKKVPSEQPLKLCYLFGDILENAIAEYRDYDDVMCNVDVIATTLLEQMSEHIPNYDDWKDCLSKEFPNQTLPQEKSDFFRLGWNSYCKKMWDMINDD